MGAWDVGHFDDDQALDWLGDVEDSDDPMTAVRRALAVGERTNTGEGCRGLAAAELIASASGARATPDRLARHGALLERVVVDLALVDAARACVEAIAEPTTA